MSNDQAAGVAERNGTAGGKDRSRAAQVLAERWLLLLKRPPGPSDQTEEQFDELLRLGHRFGDLRNALDENRDYAEYFWQFKARLPKPGERPKEDTAARIRRIQRETLERRVEEFKDATDPEQVKLCQAAKGMLAAIDAANKADEAQPEEVRSVDEWEPPIPLAEIPAPAPFPLHVLPRGPALFIGQLAEALRCPPDYQAIPLLTIAGAAIGASRALRIKQDWNERPNLYAAVIARPGSGKSPSLHKVARPVYEEQERLLGEYYAAMKRWKSEHFNAEGVIRPQTAEQPLARDLWVQNVTCEKLVEIMSRNRRGVVLIEDELTGWITGMNQYHAKGGGRDKAIYQALWNGAAIRYQRMNREGPGLTINDPFFAATGCIPPDRLSVLRGELYISDGFLDRFLLSYAEPIPEAEEDWREIDLDSAKTWANKLGFLWALEPDKDRNGPCPRLLRLDDSARTAWQNFTRELAKEVEGEEFPDYLRGAWLKMKSQCARLALIVHCLRLAEGERIADDKVDGESVGRAAELVGYFRSHARRAYCAMDADRSVDQTKRLLRWIVQRGKPEFKRWEAFNGVYSLGRFPTPESLEQPLDRLVRHHYIRPAQAVRTGAGRPPAPVYEVNPHILGDHPVKDLNPVNSPETIPEINSRDLRDIRDGSLGGEEDDLSPDVTLEG
jgi:hypothetical protein